ncbi:MAG: hypothetical protein ABGZ17_03625, partial [Planctomycetaceae bacterium]
GLRSQMNPVATHRHRTNGVCLLMLGLLSSLGGCNDSQPSQASPASTAGNTPRGNADAVDEASSGTTATDSVQDTGANPAPVAAKRPQSASTDPGETADASGSAVADVAKADPKAQVRAALKDAVQLLEQKNYNRFINYYFPVNQLRQVRKSTGYARAIFQLVRTPQAVNRWRVLLQAGVQADIVLHPRGYEARIEVEVKPADPKAEETTDAPPEPELAQVEIVGFGSELKPAIQSAITALESKDYQTLVSHMFPISQLSRMQPLDDNAPIIQRLKAHPEMSAAMLADFQHMRDQTPALNADKSVATYRIPGTKVQITRQRNMTTPDRTVRLQKTGEHWRLFDSAAAYHQQIAQQYSNGPTELRATLVLEKFGDQWRLQELP